MSKPLKKPPALDDWSPQKPLVQMNQKCPLSIFTNVITLWL